MERIDKIIKEIREGLKSADEIHILSSRVLSVKKNGVGIKDDDKRYRKLTKELRKEGIFEISNDLDYLTFIKIDRKGGKDENTFNFSSL